MRREAGKIQDFNGWFEPVTSRYRCDALTNWAMKSLTLGAGHLWVLMFPWGWGMNQWWNDIWSYIHHISYIIYDETICDLKFPWGMNQWWNDIWLHIHHIYDPFHISFHHWFVPHGNIRTYKWPAPNVSDFIAPLVRASHRYREVTGSNPVEVLNFFRLLCTIAKIAFITNRIIASLDFISAVHMWFISYIISSLNKYWYTVLRKRTRTFLGIVHQD